jgi:hypothetical protein
MIPEVMGHWNQGVARNPPPTLTVENPPTLVEATKASEAEGTVKPATERRMVLEQRFRVEFGADQGFLEKLERVRSLLSTKHHRRLEFAELFEILLDEHIERHSPESRACRRAEREQRKAGHKIQKRTAGPNEGSAKPSSAVSADPRKNQQKNQQKKQERSRHIPRSVRDKVYARDKGRWGRGQLSCQPQAALREA